MSETIQITTRQENGLGVIDMVGDITGSAEQAMEAAYENLQAGGSTKILLNFTRVEYINSAGLAIIIGLLSKSRKANRELYACGLTSHFQKIFDMVGINKYVQHFDTVEAALKDLRKHTSKPKTAG